MRLLFLAPLLTGLFSVYVARKSQDEMAYLTATVAGISLIISLMLAPWEFQLLLLIFGLSTVGYIWKKNGSENTLEVEQFQSTVQSRVNSTQTPKVIPSSVTIVPTEDTDKRKVRKYRGALIDDTPSQPAAPPSNLKYRGANVNNSSSEQ